MTLPRAIVVASLALAISTSIRAQGTVHVVDDQPGPGVHFTSLPDAVGAAASGDLIFVRDGIYAGATIANKGLVLAAEAGAAVRIDGGIEIRNLAPSRSVVLQGLELRGEPGLRLDDNHGAILVERTRLIGQHMTPMTVVPSGLYVTDSSDVTLSNCIVETAQDGTGVPTIRAFSSNLTVYDTEVRGAHGKSGGYHGSTAASLTNTSMFVAGSRFFGGDGSDGAPFLFSCGQGGHGGDGLDVMPGPTLPVITLLDTILEGGDGGSSSGWPPCGPGSDGVGLHMPTGTPTFLDHDAASLAVSSPVEADQPLTLAFDGKPGELVVLALSQAIGPTIQDELNGTLIPELATAHAFLAGAIEPDGTLELSASIGVAPGSDYHRIHTQAIHVTPSGEAILGAPATSLILASVP